MEGYEKDARIVCDMNEMFDFDQTQNQHPASTGNIEYYKRSIFVAVDGL